MLHPRPSLLPLAIGATLLPSLTSVPLGSAAPAGSLSVELAAGHDDNLFLATDPVASQALLRLGGWFASVQPVLAVSLPVGELRLEADYQGDCRYAEAVGRLCQHQVDLGAVFPPLGPVRLQLDLEGGLFDPGRFPEDHYRFAGGGGGVRLAFVDSLWLSGRYRLQWRWLDGPLPSRDRVQSIEAGLLWRPGARTEIGPFGSHLGVDPGAGVDQSRFRRLRAGVEASGRYGPLSLSSQMWAGTVALGSVGERHLGAAAFARGALARHVELVAAFEGAWPVSAGATRDYARRVFSLGLAVSAAGPFRSPGPPQPVWDLRPLVEPGRVRLRLRAPAAATVAVVGSWDDWQAPGHTLATTREPGLFELWLELPEGSYRYHFVVDGQSREPPDAPRYAPDGFGGRDGVLEVAARRQVGKAPTESVSTEGLTRMTIRKQP